MGSGVSTNLESEYPVPEDIASAKTQVEQLQEKLQDECGKSQLVSSYFKYLLEKKIPEGSDSDALDEVQELRQEILAAVKNYGALVTPNPPQNAEEIIQRSEDLLNLSSADQDDDGVPGNLYVFGVPPLPGFPQSIESKENLAALTTLSLKKNGISEIPAGIGSLVNLENLDLSENSLAELPVALTSCKNLEFLNVSENHLTEIYPSIGELANLKTLIAFKNQISKVADDLSKCAQLEEVNFFNNKLIKITDAISTLTQLKDLNLGGNKLKSFPSTKRFANLERLALSWNTIVVLQDFGGMPKLKQLQLNRNQLDSLPDDAFEGCEDLDNVDLSANRFTTLPPSLAKCSTIKSLNASSNSLNDVINLGELTSLEILNLGSNKLNSLDDRGIENLKNLVTIFVHDNDMKSLPECMGDLSQLTRINISKNSSLEISDELKTKLEGYCKANKGRWIV